MALATTRQSVLVRPEWGVFPIGESGLRPDEVDAFMRISERAARNLRLPEGSVVNRVVGGLKAGQVCGVMSYRGRSLEILPKIDGGSMKSRLALVRMLSVVTNLRVSDGEFAHLQTQRQDLLELLVTLFIRRLAHAMKGGLQRRYLRFDDDLSVMRGSLDIRQQLTKRPVAPAKLFCAFDELSEDTPLNRLLKAAVVRLLGVCRSPDNQKNLQSILDSFRDVSRSHKPLAERIENDRTATAFADLVPLARLLLTGDWQNTSTGETAGTSLLFPMNELFERYVARRAQQTLGRGIVHKQHFKHHALNDQLFRMIPDVVIDYKAAPVILDTKWKQLDPADPQKLGVAQSDIYQMLAYGHSYSKHGARPRLVLLYPLHAGLGDKEGILRNWSVTGSNLPLTIASVDISKRHTPMQWKELFSKIAPVPMAIAS